MRVPSHDSPTPHSGRTHDTHHHYRLIASSARHKLNRLAFLCTKPMATMTCAAVNEGNPLEAENPRESNTTEDIPRAKKLTWRFWLALTSVCLMSFISSMGSSIATSLPKISDDLRAGTDYVWIACSFLFAQTAIQPACAQLCNIFGRRNPMIIAVLIFAAGSTIAGSSSTSKILIAGRTVQGLASGCINMLSEVIVCDLVPLRERGKYVSFVLSAIAMGTVVGPITSGALADHHWRWIFYMNLPICGIVLVKICFFLRLRHKREPTWRKALSRVDWIGNALFISSISAIMIGIIRGGNPYPWTSLRVIIPLVLGTTGWVVFHIFEQRKYCQEPTIPPWIFSNRTSVAGYLMSFSSSIILQWAGFFWPVYFQMRGASPLTSAIYLLPFLLCLMPVAAVSGIILSKIGRYRPLHAIGFTLAVLGLALNTILKPNSAKAIFVVLEMVNAAGHGILLPTLLPAILASLSESDVATATGVYSFLRSFGYVWGIIVPSIIFNNQFKKEAWRIQDPRIREALAGGRAYESISGTFITGLPQETRGQVLTAYNNSLRAIWIGAIIFSFAGALGILIEKHIPLRKSLETEFGLDESQAQSSKKETGGMHLQGSIKAKSEG